MPIQLDFDYKINSSLQINDLVFAAAPLGLSVISDQMIYLGKVTHMSGASILTDGEYQDPTPDDFTNPDSTIDYLNGYYILFSKNVEINESSIKGYYADVKFVNSSSIKSELFSISADAAPSSK